MPRARAWVAGVVACALGAALLASVPTASATATGQVVAFVSDRDGDPEIFVVHPDGSDVLQLTSNTVWDTDPSWAPLGGRLAFSSNRDGDDDIYVMNSDGTGVVNVTGSGTGNDVQPDWSRDGSRIVFVRDGDIYVVAAAGGTPIKLARGRSPSWSPVAARILFVRNEGDIYVMDADGSNIRALTSGLEADGPEWSPDGRRIAFEAIEPTTDESRIYLMNADGSGISELPGTGEDYSPSWSPDGQRLVFTNIRLDANIVVSNLSGSERTEIVGDPAYDFLPAWNQCLGTACAGPSPTGSPTVTPSATSSVGPSPTASSSTTTSPSVTPTGPDSRTATRTTLQFLRTRRAIKAVGRVTPRHPGLAVRVTLSKRRAGRWPRVAMKMPLMNSEGRFVTRFKNPARAKRCRLQARFDGDDDHLGSRRTVRFRC